METQNELELEVGEKEHVGKTLEPKKVKIVEVKIATIEKAKSEKVNCLVKHPDKEELIGLSSVSFIEDKQIVTRGLWFNKDEDGKIQKGSAVAVLLQGTDSTKLLDLVGKEIDTELEGKFLAFKLY